MTTVATEQQVRIFRAVAGAVKNAADGHPDWKLSRRFTKTLALSVAKRATGTLTALAGPDVLAARLRSDKAEGVLDTPSADALCPSLTRRKARGASQRAKAGAGQSARRSPLKFLHNRIGAMAGAARHAGETEREEAFKEVLRLIAKQLQKVSP